MKIRREPHSVIFKAIPSFSGKTSRPNRHWQNPPHMLDDLIAHIDDVIERNIVSRHKV